LAHEIKNPLTPIQLSAERLEYRCADKLPEKEREILERSTKTIIAQVDALKSMVNAFRDYAQAPDLELREFYLTDLLQDMITLYRPRNSQIELFSHFHENEETRTFIEADINRLRQVLHNLFKNAYDALTSALEQKKIARGEIFLTTETIEQFDESNPQAESFQFVRIILMDNAGGFSEEMLDSLFEPYVTTKTKGTGLGLAIVRKIIEEHLGEIELSNHAFEDGQIGAKATILLPLDEAARLFTLTHGQSMRGVIEKITQRDRHRKKMSAEILVVDDEHDIRSLVEQILSDEGYAVTTAANAEEARQQQSEVNPDLILLDIWMPDVDGISLLKEWSQTGTQTAPVVMMSGHGTVETAVEATRLGAYDFIEKPLSMAKLLSTVEKALSEARPIVRKTTQSLIPPLIEPIGKSKTIQKARNDARLIAEQDANVLVVGEPGTGREAFARYIHSLSESKAGPFVNLVPSSLDDNELVKKLCGFIDEQGHLHAGIFHAAQDGVVFINELEDVSTKLQRLLNGVTSHYLTRFS